MRTSGSQGVAPAEEGLRHAPGVGGLARLEVDLGEAAGGGAVIALAPAGLGRGLELAGEALGRGEVAREEREGERLPRLDAPALRGGQRRPAELEGLAHGRLGLALGRERACQEELRHVLRRAGGGERAGHGLLLVAGSFVIEDARQILGAGDVGGGDGHAARERPAGVGEAAEVGEILPHHAHRQAVLGVARAGALDEGEARLRTLDHLRQDPALVPELGVEGEALHRAGADAEIF